MVLFVSSMESIALAKNLQTILHFDFEIVMDSIVVVMSGVRIGFSVPVNYSILFLMKRASLVFVVGYTGSAYAYGSYSSHMVMYSLHTDCVATYLMDSVSGLIGFDCNYCPYLFASSRNLARYLDPKDFGSDYQSYSTRDLGYEVRVADHLSMVGH